MLHTYVIPRSSIIPVNRKQDEKYFRCLSLLTPFQQLLTIFLGTWAEEWHCRHPPHKRGTETPVTGDTHHNRALSNSLSTGEVMIMFPFQTGGSGSQGPRGDFLRPWKRYGWNPEDSAALPRHSEISQLCLMQSPFIFTLFINQANPQQQSQGFFSFLSAFQNIQERLLHVSSAMCRLQEVSRT